MKFTPTPLKDAFLIDLEKKGDDRGFFARLYCREEFLEHGLEPTVIQANNSFSGDKGTLRGMHYQLAPKAEEKVIRCVKGGLFDVIIDVRQDSETFLQHFSIELTEDNRTMLYVPKGFAHGFMTITEDAEALYLATEYYAPDLERGIRYNDPRFEIAWPMDPVIISDKDREHADFDPEIHLK